MGAAVRGAIADAGVDADQGRRHRHRLHGVHDGADARRRHAAVPARRVQGPPARLRQAVEAPRRAAAGRPHQRARRAARRAVAGALRRVDLVGVGVSPRGSSCSTDDPEVYDAMERWVEGADWIVWQLCGRVRAQRLQRRLQGHPPGRPVPEPRLPRRARPGLRRLRRRPSSTSRSAASAGAPASLTAEMAAQLGLPAGIAVAVGNVDAHVTAPAAAGRDARGRWWRSWARRRATS